LLHYYTSYTVIIVRINYHLLSTLSLFLVYSTTKN